MAATLGLPGLLAARDVRAWLGDEAGLALVPAGTATAPLLLATVRHRANAAGALRRLGARAAGRSGTAALYRPPAGGAAARGPVGASGAGAAAARGGPPATGALVALTSERLLAGPEAAVRAALARSGPRRRARRERGLRRAMAGRGDGGVDVYAPATTREALARAQGPLARRLTGQAQGSFQPFAGGALYAAGDARVAAVLREAPATSSWPRRRSRGSARPASPPAASRRLPRCELCSKARRAPSRR